MSDDLLVFLASLASVVVYVLVLIPLGRRLVGRLTGRPFEFRLRPEHPPVEGQWRDIAWSSAFLVVTMALGIAAAHLLGSGG